ncbi:MAG: hypothetical protein O7H41_07010 [Planctomycetota bacterium]|nr:hypothetical protein [Planctomycetota bacterium]
MGSALLDKHLILSGQRHPIEDVRDELFIDFRAGPGTQFLASTCYGAAVIDVQVVGSDYFILKVRPALRALLMSQLRREYRTYRVYCFEGNSEGRILLTDELVLEFTEGASHEARRASLHRYFPSTREEEQLDDGIYRLAGTFSEDPILVSNALQGNPMIASAAPILVAIPTDSEIASDREWAEAEVNAPELALSSV